MTDDKDKATVVDETDIPDEALRELSDNEGGEVGVE